MKNYRVTRYRLLPGKHGKSLSKIAGANRYIWNYFLGENIRKYNLWKEGKIEKKPSTSFLKMTPEFTELRKNTQWIKDLPCAEVRFVLNRLSNSFKELYKQGYGYPKFKSKMGDDSFSIPFNLKFENKKLYIPKVGKVKLQREGEDPWLNDENSTLKTAVIKRELGKWYAYLCYEVQVEMEPTLEDFIGIDLNVGNIALSNGTMYIKPNMSTLEARRKRYQRMMSRRVKGSNRRNDSKIKAAKTSRKIQNKMNSWKHRVSSGISQTYDTVVVEDLYIKNMTKSAKGTIENPGTNVSQKRGLNRSIQGMGWGNFLNMLEYKSNNTIKVDPRYTSQTCTSCGLIDKNNRKTQSKFECLGCGYKLNADINASRNIMALGIGATAQGEAFPLGTSMICEKIYSGGLYGK